MDAVMRPRPKGVSLMSFRVRQIDPIAEPALRGEPWDYADSFDVLFDEPDDHPAEEWLRAAIEQAGEPMRRLIRLVHRGIVRFDFDEDAANGFIGWRQIVAEQDVAAIEADGSLLRAVLVARRHSPTRCTGSTYLFFHKPTASRLMWLVVRPIHVRVERHLLAGAARVLTKRHAKVPAA
jgi:hypothetical protein